VSRTGGLQTARCARQGIKNSEMPLDECRAFGKGGLPVLIGTEAMCEALEHGFAPVHLQLLGECLPGCQCEDTSACAL